MRKFLLVTAAMFGMATSATAMDFNLGVQGGYGSSESDLSNASFHGPESYSVDSDGWILGGFAGVDWDVGPGWSLGVEGDYNWTDAEGDVLGFHLYTIEQNWNASVRARVAFDIAANTELFGSLGPAWTEVDVISSACGGCDTGIDTLEGWAAGIGLERQFTGWFGRIEYRYSAYDEDDFDHSGGAAAVDLTTHALLLGAGLKLGH